ncbi:MAG TPA: hypothetical protein VE954_16460 [Oligoflexus sp.]|uniref:monooxygenase n=1 Tax=Oligoflexus sp. TaxID=1971216 RepID=UPI002D64DAD2|nr:hypothetical protein [Oligoflexus sp.]HYX34692.1 hypothetical protein [Oligoflexus sp.]
MKLGIFLLAAFFSWVDIPYVFADKVETQREALGQSPLQDLESTEAVSYYQNIKPIIDAHCVGCHHVNGQAPFALDTYAAVKSRSSWIAGVTAAKIMPPWGANPIAGHELSYDTSLSDAKIQLIQDWVQAGSPAGDPSRPGPALLLPTPQLTGTDMTFQMKEAWTTVAGEEDEYRCFPVVVDAQDEFYVTGYKLEHDNASLVHHAFVYSFDPEYAPQVEAMENSDDRYGYPCMVAPTTDEYAGIPPHTLAVSGLQGYEFTFPKGKGVLVKPGTTLIFQLHYSKRLMHVGHNDATHDTSRTRIHFSTEKKVEKPIELAYFVDLKWMEPDSMKIPAGEKDVSYSYKEYATQSMAFMMTKGNLNVDSGFFINGIFPRQHLLARGMKVWVERSSGVSEIIFDSIDRYNFHFQSIFQYEKPIFVAKDDQLKLTCTWDNSAENQPIVDGVALAPIDVYWGEETKDEMCVATLMIFEP